MGRYDPRRVHGARSVHLLSDSIGLPVQGALTHVPKAFAKGSDQGASGSQPGVLHTIGSTPPNARRSPYGTRGLDDEE